MERQPCGLPAAKQTLSRLPWAAEIHAIRSLPDQFAKKQLDVWSIYKCVRCAYTRNISLFSRLPVSKIDPHLYERLMANDKSAAEDYSHDLQVLRRNSALLAGSPEFVVREGWRISLVRAAQVSVNVYVERAFQVSLLAVLRRQLGLSGSAIRKCLAAGDIAGITLKELRSPRIRPEGHRLYIVKELLLARRRISLNTGSDLRR